MDLISDALTRILNASERRKEDVLLRPNNAVLAVVDVIEKEGFIEDYSENDDGILVVLLYEDETPVISSIERVSSGGQRVYVGASDLKPVLSGRGIGIISTSQGMMTIDEARSKSIGGEYICKIW